MGSRDLIASVLCPPPAPYPTPGCAITGAAGPELSQQRQPRCSHCRMVSSSRTLKAVRSSSGECSSHRVGTQAPFAQATASISNASRMVCCRGWHCFSPPRETVLISSFSSKRTHVLSGWSGTTDRAGDAGRKYSAGSVRALLLLLFHSFISYNSR